ncbi:glutathione S-transferase [Aureobasidium pullulans]|uniref:glutathione transferase n=1 Tax=Aureobasidium pullulans TaxID=5580 RepID=A0A4S9A0T9_AURPU|nr:glutathione S-transferase [Aureobasidium pullulans]
MPAFVLYGARGSTNTDRVRLTLAEGGFTDYELVLADLQRGEQKSDENMKRHPWGKVPVLTFPDGFTLHESRAICKHVARKYSFPLLPSSSDVNAMALFDQAESVEISYFLEPAGKIAFEKFVKKRMGLPADEKIVSDALRFVEMYLEIAERSLLQKKFVAGDEFTLVDIYYIPLIRRLFACGYGDLILRHGAVNAWWNRCIDRPAIKKLFTADEEAMAVISAAAR